MERAAALRRAVTAMVVVAMVLPVVRDRDGLPLSTYPMYATVRSNEVRFTTAVGLDADGRESGLTISTIAGTRDPLIAQSYLNDAVRRGDADTVCAAIADRLAGQALVSIEIATEQHDTVKRMRGEQSLLDRQVHAACEVVP